MSSGRVSPHFLHAIFIQGDALVQELAASFDYGAEDQTPPASMPVFVLWNLVLDIGVGFGIDADHRSMR